MLNGYYRLCLRLHAALSYVGFSLLDSFTACFGLLGHLYMCTCLLLFKESAVLLFGYVVALCMLPICGVGKVVIWDISTCCLCYFLVLLYVCFLLPCIWFLCCFPSFFIVSCMCIFLLAFPCGSLSVLCCYLLSISCSILNIGLLGSMALSFMCRLFLYVVFF
jgi:hypothetical protein